jgi:hypothetical protein
MGTVDRDSVREEQLAHVLEEIGRLEDDLGAGALTVPGSKGQPMPNRLLAELRAHRWLLLRMLDGAGPGGDRPPAEDVVDRIRAEWEAGGD